MAPGQVLLPSQNGTDTSKEQKKELWQISSIANCSTEDLRQNLENQQLIGYAVDYCFSVEGAEPGWNDASMDREINADINLASYPKHLGALLNKWGRLAESLFNGELETDNQSQTVNHSLNALPGQHQTIL
ncbi:hypothetical protein DdX_12917 [Ditylenchus destructor]|uniref:Uncharacterized protein n=1 Tax=Ditylenchus destructor TaxID=166010 RepID=A0AAD4R018_9BILA|nr:hypothetical protein DdX_12917 [Ditylenchus destructor]